MASKRAIRRRQCGNKKRYVLFNAALSAKHKTDSDTKAVYKCKYCGGYHLGRRSNKTQLAIDNWRTEKLKERNYVKIK